MMRWMILPVFLALYLAVVFPFTSYMRNRPFVEKMGYVPEPGILKLLSFDQYRFVASTLLMSVINYFGGLAEGGPNRVQLPPEYPEMERVIRTSVQLDPYNADAYYFSQAIMVWDARQVTGTTELLEYGMKYRTWDYYLPFFAGFNYAFFMKDYARAARQYQRLAELTGNEISITTAGRYLYESGNTDLAISYLKVMVQTARNDAVRTNIQTRLSAFQAVKKIELAAQAFKTARHRPPRSIEELHASGFLADIPVDPYKGTFYIDKDGKVRTTSKFAFAHLKKGQ